MQDPPRMRTARGALEALKAADPDTAITLHAIRYLIRTGTLPSVPMGRKKLISVDALIAYLRDQQPGKENED